MKISNRLKQVADLVPEGMSVADIGTDHGYVPIYLALSGKTSRIIAMDINKGPLGKAIDNIAENNVGHIVTTRLSNGLEKLEEGEVDCIIIAGMGGPLVKTIIKSQINKAHSAKMLLLSPQSEVGSVRQFLLEENFRIEDELMLAEDGKFYFIMKVVNGEDAPYDEKGLEYGRFLIQRKDPVMKDYLAREKRICEKVISTLTERNQLDSPRFAEVNSQLEMIKEGLAEYDT